MKKKCLILLCAIIMIMCFSSCGGTIATCNFCGVEAKCKSMDENIDICKDCLKKAKNGEELYLGDY